MGWRRAHLRHVHRTHLNTLKYHLDAVNHRKAHAACLCKRSGETSWHTASKATWWVMCARERAEETAEGQRCYCLTQYQHSPDEWPRMCPDVRTGPRRCPLRCPRGNESLAHLDSGPLLLFYGLTCHDRGMTATLSRREGEERGDGGQGRRRCGLRADRGGGRGGGAECRLRRREEMKDK